MPAVGDLRQRLMALADESVLGNSAICRLCAHRLPLDGSGNEHRHELATIISGDHALALGVPPTAHSVVARLLRALLEARSHDVDLRGACVGNLLLAGGYLESDRDLLSALSVFSALVSAQGIVRPIVNDHAHLFAELENGRVLMGQHELTGKEALPIESPVRHLFLSRRAGHYEPANVVLGDDNRALITSADLICFAPGAFTPVSLLTFCPKE